MAKPTDLVQGSLDLLILTNALRDAPAVHGLEHRATHSSGFERSLAGPSRCALSRAASPRATRVDSRQMGRIGKQSPRQILFADSDGVKYMRQEQAQWKRLSSAIGLVLEMS